MINMSTRDTTRGDAAISELDLIEEFLAENTVRELAIQPPKLPGPPPPPRDMELQEQSLGTRPRHPRPELVSRGTAPTLPCPLSQVHISTNGMASSHASSPHGGASLRSRGGERSRGGAARQGQADTELLERFLEKPVLLIPEQPKERGMRFRYECEGRSAGSILGASSTEANKTVPAVEIKGCKQQIKKIKITVSLVTKDIPHRPHPHSLVGKDCADGVCVVRLNPRTSCRHSFSNLGIQCVRRKELEMALEKRRNQKIDPFNTGHSKSIEDIDLNVVRLCFQCELETDGEEKIHLSPVVSNAIYDKKATTTSELKINRLNVVRGPCTGKTEIYLLCDKVQKDDIEIIYSFGEWEAKAEFAQTDVHRQIAIVFKSPPYQEQDISEEVEVNVFLRRLSDHMDSEPVKFTYMPQNPDPYEVNRKRKLKSDIKFSERCSVDVTVTEPGSSHHFAPLPFIVPEMALPQPVQTMEEIHYPSVPMDIKQEDNICPSLDIMLESAEIQTLLSGVFQVLDGSAAAGFQEPLPHLNYGLHNAFSQDPNSNLGMDLNSGSQQDMNFYNDMYFNSYSGQLLNGMHPNGQPLDPRGGPSDQEDPAEDRVRE
ncbi:hypothetical protein AAFF_G00195650 [Aldrovandia affinis]|uniref:RHD domain-containing protein n=1 Tax=Aldrovandia affinis TaxID=143900 RepID=A0AAD7W6A7_9TELE|nr:hypothetical protein AAFF_G00195650 [Aldrovandia affinis]